MMHPRDPLAVLEQVVVLALLALWLVIAVSGCHLHVLEMPATTADDARHAAWRQQVTELLNEYDRRLDVLETKEDPTP